MRKMLDFLPIAATFAEEVPLKVSIYSHYMENFNPGQVREILPLHFKMKPFVGEVYIVGHNITSNAT